MAKKPTVNVVRKPQEYVFFALKSQRNGEVQLRALSNQSVQTSSGIIVIPTTLPLVLESNKKPYGRVEIQSLQSKDVIVVPSYCVTIGATFMTTYPIQTLNSGIVISEDSFCLLKRSDFTKHPRIELASVHHHIAYQEYLGCAEVEEHAPPATNINSYYHTLVKSKKAKLPSIEEDSFYVESLIWFYLVRNINKQIPTLLTGPSGTGKTELVDLVCKRLNKTLHVIDMSGMTDPVAGLIGVHRLNKNGSYFDFSRFSEVIQDPKAVVLLDELNRAALESANILLPVTDGRKQLYCDVASKDVARIIDVKATIVATANIGFEYAGTQNIDRALLDRFEQIELSTLLPEHEEQLLVKRTEISIEAAHQIMNIITEVRQLYNKRQLSTFVSTRYSIGVAKLVVDGWDIVEAIKLVIYPLFEGTTTEDGERLTVHSIVQKLVQDTFSFAHSA